MFTRNEVLVIVRAIFISLQTDAVLSHFIVFIPFCIFSLPVILPRYRALSWNRSNFAAPYLEVCMRRWAVPVAVMTRQVERV